MGLDPDHVLDLILYPLRICRWKIDLVDHRENVQVVINGQIYICKGLCFYTLGRIHHKDRSLTGRKRTGYFIIEVHMARGVDQVKDILLPVICLINDTDRLGLDGDPALPFDIHVVQHLLLHFPLGQGPGLLNDPVRQGGFAMVDVGNDTKVSDFTLV